MVKATNKHEKKLNNVIEYIMNSKHQFLVVFHTVDIFIFIVWRAFPLPLEDVKVTTVPQQYSQQVIFNFSFQGDFETWVLKSWIKHLT